MVKRFLAVHDIRQALNIQKQFALEDVQIFRQLAVYHYKNKNETEQRIIEDKVWVQIIIKIGLTPRLTKRILLSILL